MSLVFEKMVAGRYLRSKRREGFISIIAGFSFLGIMLGVATLIIVMSVMNGFREELIGHILGLNGHVNVYSRLGTFYPYEPVAKRLEKIPGVQSAIPTIEGQALLTVEGAASGVMVRGMRPEDLDKKPLLQKSFIKKISADASFFGGENVVIGNALSERIGVSIGDQIVLIAPKGKVTPFGTMPRSKAFTVGGIFDVGMYEYNNGFVFMPLPIAQAFFNMGEGISALEITTPSAQESVIVKKSIENELLGEYGVSGWQDSNASFYNALQVERNVMFLILTLIIIVAAFNIISSLIMLVKDKARDIAILRTMGATRSSVIRIFFYTGASIGIFGTITGAALGICFAQNIESIRQWLQKLTKTDLFSSEIYFLSKLPAKMEPMQVVTIVVMALGLSFAATIYPAWRAARLDPVEALRRE